MKIIRRGVAGVAIGTGFVVLAVVALVGGWLAALVIAELLVK
jgi:hypothetical protein